MDIRKNICTPYSGNIYTSVVKILNPALNYIFILQFKYLYLSENISTRYKNIHLGGNISTLVKIFLSVNDYVACGTLKAYILVFNIIGHT